MTEWPELIGPAQALELVETRLPNTRPPDHYEKTQRAFAKRMRSGKWEELGVSRIVLDEEGRLADGVQRLMAVVYAGVEVEFLVNWQNCKPWFPELKKS